MPPGPLSRTMMRALEALRDGRSCDINDRPKYVTIRTMLGLKARGLVRYEDGKWVIVESSES